MKITYLINEETLKRYSLITDNVDSKYINVAIRDAQNQALQPVLGSFLFDTLCNMVIDGTIEENEPYKTLLDEYIQPFLIWECMSTIQIGLFAKITNNGMRQNVGDNATPISIKEIQYLKDYYSNKAVFYSNRLSDFLCANSSQYPEWKSTRTIADMKSDKRAYNTTIVL